MAHPALPLPTAPDPTGSNDATGSTGTAPVEVPVTMIPIPEPAAQPDSGTDPDTGDFDHEDTGGRAAAVVFAGLIGVLALVLVVLAAPVVVRLVAGTVAAFATAAAIKALCSGRSRTS